MLLTNMLHEACLVCLQGTGGECSRTSASGMWFSTASIIVWCWCSRCDTWAAPDLTCQQPGALVLNENLIAYA